MISEFVVAGLDPAIHRSSQDAFLAKQMDPRVKPWVKPAGDGRRYASMPARMSSRSALSFHTSICTILPLRTTKRST